jgi:hypothetical protein
MAPTEIQYNILPKSKSTFQHAKIRNRSLVIALDVRKGGSVNQYIGSRLTEVSLYGGISQLDT